jgi:hypothetical protein
VLKRFRVVHAPSPPGPAGASFSIVCICRRAST